MKILIVDDAAFVREALAQICMDLCHKVCGFAKNGIEAEDLSIILKPDIIIMDLVMPEVNGIQATKAILKKNSNIKIIACTTLESDFKEKSLEAGCVAFLEKPFNKKKVEEILTSILNQNTISGGPNV